MSLQLGIPLFFLAGIVQTTIMSRLEIAGGQPDLIVLVVLAWAILDKGQEGMVWGFVGGLVLDLFSTTPFGISSVALVVVTFFVSLAESQVYRESLILPVFLGGLGAAGYHAIYMILLRVLDGVPLGWSEVVVYVTLPSILFDIILIVPVVRLLSGVYDQLHPRALRF
jgi:rod shape-determining protein MreD